jgi:hypothetical protein
MVVLVLQEQPIQVAVGVAHLQVILTLTMLAVLEDLELLLLVFQRYRIQIHLLALQL